MPRFQDIPELTRSGSYMVNVGLDYLARHYMRYVKDYGLDVSPDFQRGNVWTTEQKIRFMEYMLRGGSSGLDIYINCPTFNHGSLDAADPKNSCVLVDGKQRLDAALGFLNNEFPAFGHYFREYTDRINLLRSNFRWHVNDLQTRAEVLQWYLDLNSGGTVHTEDELTKVRELLQSKAPYIRPSVAEMIVEARFDREIIVEAVREDDEVEKRRAQSVADSRAAEAIKPKRGKKAR